MSDDRPPDPAALPAQRYSSRPGGYRRATTGMPRATSLLPRRQPQIMARATPIGCRRDGALDILLKHQPLFDELSSRRLDCLDIGLRIWVAFENRSSRV